MQFPTAPDDVIKLLVLPNQQLQTQRYSVSYYMEQRLEANPHNLEPGTRERLAVLLEK